MKNLLKNKKAILAEEVTRIVLAVLGIIVLIILAVQLYSIFTRSSDLEQAKATLNEILAKASLLDESGKHTDLLVIAPGARKGGNNWKIVSYPEAKELCICPIVSGLSETDACHKQGTCQKRDYKVELLDFTGIVFTEITLPMQITIFNQGGIIRLKSGKYDFISVKNKDSVEEAAITPASAPVKEIIFKDSLEPNSDSGINFRTLDMNKFNDASSLRINYDKSGNYVDISMFSSASKYYSADVVGRIYSDGSVWLSPAALIPLKTTKENLFVNQEEYNKESLIINFGMTELPVDSNTKVPVSNSATMKYTLVDVNKVVGSTPQNYKVYRAIFKTNLVVNFEDVKSRAIYQVK